MNIGVNPIYLLETLKNRFLAMGGKLFENTPFSDIVIHPNGVIVNNQFTAKLLLDAMEIFRQLANKRVKKKNQMHFV